MLGEDHSLSNDFPELEQKIEELTRSDTRFAEKNKKYRELDKEIRKLELNNEPIQDEEMTRLKHDRAVLKDELYATLTGQSLR